MFGSGRRAGVEPAEIVSSKPYVGCVRVKTLDGLLWVTQPPHPVAILPKKEILLRLIEWGFRNPSLARDRSRGDERSPRGFSFSLLTLVLPATMGLPLPAQADSKSGFSLRVLKSRAGAKFALLGLTAAGVLYYLPAPDSYRPELAWPREKPFVVPPPPPAWEPDFEPPPPLPPPPHEGETPVKPPLDPQMAERAEAVRRSFRHAYDGYIRTAWTYDELLPKTNGSVNNFNGWGVSVIDSISTIQLMGLKPEYDRALDFVAKMNFDIKNDGHAPFFETAIRYLGGLAERVVDVMKKVAPRLQLPGLFPIWWERTSGTPIGGSVATRFIHNCINKLWIDHVSLGAMADSGFEYLLKQYLLTGRTETGLRDIWLEASDSIISHMPYISPIRKLLYITDISGSEHSPSGKLEHLSCFLPGLFALGADQLTEKEGMTKQRKERYMWAAIGLTNTCIGVYEDMETSLGAETVQFYGQNSKWIDELNKWERTRGSGDLPPGVTSKWTRVGSNGRRDYFATDPTWLSRPETLESVFLLWRTTRDPVWRERGWAAFQAIEKYSKTQFGYGSVLHLDNKKAAPSTNSQPSYFLAETLKYLFLLFSDDSALPLDRFIFNTEAHPLGVWKWSDWEMEK